MAASIDPTLVEVLRGATVESVHRGAIAVVDADGALVASRGDIDRPIFPRSAVKVLQALPLVASGAADRLQLTDAELAIACASHRGEPIHAATAAGMLAKAGLDQQALECGAHWPYDEAAARALAEQHQRPSPLHNNCSGKHSGFLCLACALHDGPDLRQYVRGYIAPAHPVMREGNGRVAGRNRCRPRAGAARHRRLLDPDFRGAAAEPRARVRPRRHRHRSEPRAGRGGETAARPRSRRRP